MAALSRLWKALQEPIPMPTWAFLLIVGLLIVNSLIGIFGR